MKLTVFILCISIFGVLASNSYSQNAKLSLHMNNTTIKAVLNEIEDNSEFYFLYNNNLVDVDREVSINVKDKKVPEILDEVFEGQDVKYDIRDRQIIISPKDINSSVRSSQPPVKGKVTDDRGEPLPGATVMIKGTTVGVITDVDGNFSINATSDDVLVFSFVGMLSQQITVGSQTSINVSLKADAVGIEEVVAIGYGTQKKKDLTGAIATVNEESFNKGVVVSPEQLLQGKVSGVNITSASGEPGAAQAITIRGPGSIRSGNTPLYVVDGVPLTTDATSAGGENFGYGGQSAKNPMNFINPNDIESIDVLKDASAAAIYGARGSNGVIIITTKSGKKGTAKMDYSSEFGVSTIARKIEVLSADEFRDYHNSAGTSEYIGNVDTDWQDEIFRTAVSQNHKLSLSNATEYASYYASLSYLDQEGIVDGSNLTRFTGRINASQKMWDNKLKINLNLTASRINDDAVPIGDNPSADGDLITNALVMNPTYPVRNADGSFFDQDGMINPVALNDIYTDFSNSNRVLGNIDATLQIMKGLTYKVNLGVDNATSTRNTQMSKHTFTGIKSSPEGRLYVSNVENRSYLIDNILTYDFSLQDHNFKVLAGHSYQNFYIRSYGFGTSTFSTDEIDAIYNPGIGSVVDKSNGDWPSGGAREDELQSFFGRVNYSLADKYLLTFTLRHDGSSRFGENNKYGTFPSVSGAWRVGEEDFLADWEALHNLKLRVGWGQTGNQEVPSKQTLASVTSNTGSGTGYPLGQADVVPGIRFVRNANPDLKWEVVTQTNIGFDYAFFDGSLYGSVDYFNKVTTDALLQVNVVDPMESAGGSMTWKNLEDTKIVNNGWELELGYQNKAGEVKYNFGTNVTLLKNEVKDLQGIYYSGSLNGPGMTGDQVLAYISGESIGSFYLPEFLGFNADGQSTYRAADGGTKLGSEITTDDYIIAGSAIPDVTYNFFGSFEYKNFDFSFNFNGVAGNYVYNNTANAYFRRPFLAGGNNVETRLLEKYPDESTVNVDKPSTRYLEKGNFLRLNNVSLGYNLNPKIKYIENMRLYVTGQNLFVITDYSGYDPEVNTNKNIGGRTSYGIDMSSYPKSRTFLFGINVSF